MKTILLCVAFAAAGCAMQSVPSTTPTVMSSRAESLSSRAESRDATTPLLYIADGAANVVSVYKQSHHRKPIATIAAGVNTPQGLFVDTSLNVYVTNAHAQNVTVYPRGGSQPTQTLQDPNGIPIAVARCNDGTTYVANFFTLPLNPGDVAVYPAGAISPTYWIEYSHAAPRYLACDRASHVYVSYEPRSGNGAVMRYDPGGRNGVQIPLDPGPIQVDAAGDIVIWDRGFTVDFYHPHHHKPFKQIPIPHGDIPNALALDRGDANLWLIVNFNEVLRISIGSGKVTGHLGPFSDNGTTGVALSPPD